MAYLKLHPLRPVVLIGNGINLLNDSNKSWNDILAEVQLRQLNSLDQTLPESYLYEKTLLDKNHCLTGAVKGNEIVDYEDYFKKQIAECVGKFGRNGLMDKVYRELVNLRCKHILTTNYDYLFSDYLLENGYKVREVKDLEKLYSLSRFKEFSNGQDSIKVWHIHGELAKPSSLLLGYDQYCSYIYALGLYLNRGGFPDARHNDILDYEKIKKIKSDNLFYPFIIHKVEHPRRHKMRVWVDTFFHSDVHIIGLGLSFSELDIWHLLIKRARYIKRQWKNPKNNHNIVIHNKIFVYGQFEERITNMLKSLDVDVTNVVSSPLNDYEDLYLSCIESIKKNIEIRTDDVNIIKIR